MLLLLTGKLTRLYRPREKCSASARTSPRPYYYWSRPYYFITTGRVRITSGRVLLHVPSALLLLLPRPRVKCSASPRTCPRPDYYYISRPHVLITTHTSHPHVLIMYYVIINTLCYLGRGRSAPPQHVPPLLFLRYYRGTTLIRNSLPLGTYSSICLGPYGGPRGGGCFL